MRTAVTVIVEHDSMLAPEQIVDWIGICMRVHPLGTTILDEVTMAWTMPAADEAGLRPASEWERIKNVQIVDPDGWRNARVPWDQPIDRTLFEKLAGLSTVNHRPGWNRPQGANA